MMLVITKIFTSFFLFSSFVTPLKSYGTKNYRQAGSQPVFWSYDESQDSPEAINQRLFREGTYEGVCIDRGRKVEVTARLEREVDEKGEVWVKISFHRVDDPFHLPDSQVRFSATEGFSRAQLSSTTDDEPRLIKYLAQAGSYSISSGILKSGGRFQPQSFHLAKAHVNSEGETWLIYDYKDISASQLNLSCQVVWVDPPQIATVGLHPGS